MTVSCRERELESVRRAVKLAWWHVGLTRSLHVEVQTMPCITASMTGGWITSVLLPWVYSCMTFHTFIVPHNESQFYMDGHLWRPQLQVPQGRGTALGRRCSEACR